ncbi:hypothetical protein C8R45DRAFT_1105178 [Mycena sanguinolenta]|nr:hypothetical protein C8R45DRAFT_1105178 [Mycena sanguinolenta]
MPSIGLTKAQSNLGPWDLAICFTMFLQGVLCSQFTHYLGSTRRDSLQIKLFVAGLALLTTLKTSQSLAIMWLQNVTLFGNVKVASSLWHTSWYSRLTVVLKPTVGFYVQMFFCYRLWASVFGYIAPPTLDSITAQAISRNVYIVIICFMLFLFAFICGVLTSFYVFIGKRIGVNLTNHWFEIEMGVMVGGDFVLTGSIIFWLLRHNKAVLSRGPTATILSSLVRLASAVPITLCSLINLAVMILRASAPDTPAFLMLNLITNNILPHLYAWSAMWTLNSRDEIVAAGNSLYTLNLGIASYASYVKTGRIPHASNGAVTNESPGTHQENQASSQTFSEP